MKNKFHITTAVLLFSTFFALPLSLLAQDGSLDLTFGTGGAVVTEIEGTLDVGYCTAIQNDGKILVGGYSFNDTQATYHNFALVRHNTDGSLDNTFGNGGKVITDFGGESDEAHSIAIQNDGKIVLAGNSGGVNSKFALARYNTDGSLDNTFDNDGKVTTSFGNFHTSAYSVAIQNDGKIVAAGLDYNNSPGSDIILARYNIDGSLDNSFGTGGKVFTFIGIGAVGFSVAIQNDGKILVAGATANNNSDDDLALVRYNANGSLDNTFDNDGIATTNFGTQSAIASSVVLQDDGKIVVAGYSVIDQNNEDLDFALVRFNPDGSLDNTFDNDGKVTTDFGFAYARAYSVVIQSDGKILVSGESGNWDRAVTLIRYNTDGSLDNTFGVNGIVTTLIGNGGSLSHSNGLSVAIQSDGKIVVAGFSWVDNIIGNNFLVVRYNNTIHVNTDITENRNTKFSIYPNPFNASATLEAGIALENATLTVHSLSGQVVKTINNISEQTVIIQRDDLTSGMYFIQVTQSDKVLLTDKFVIAD